MYPLWHGRGGFSGREEQHSRGTDDPNMGNQRPWFKEEEKRKGWSRDPAGGWLRDMPPNGYSTLNGTANGFSGKNHSPLNKANSNLWNRRRTNSTNSIPSLSGGSPQGSHSPVGNHSPNNLSTTSTSPCSSSAVPSLQRGSSASPRVPHTKGFWVQDPDEAHQVWVGTETPDSEGSKPSLSTPPFRPSSTNGCRFLSQPPSALSTPVSQKVVSPSTSITSPTSSSMPIGAIAPKVYKSHATWVRSPDSPGSDQQIQGHAQSSMSGPHAGDGGETGEVLDFQNRVKKFQQQDSQHSQQQVGVAASRNAATSSSSQVKRSQHSGAHSLSSSNLAELKSSSAVAASTKSSSNLSELKSSISEVKSNISEMTAQSNSFSRSMSKSSSSAVQQSSSRQSSATASGFGKLATTGFKSMGSLDALANMGSSEQLALPDVSDELASLSDGGSSAITTTSSPHASQNEMKFEEKKVSSSSKTKVVTDKNSFESASGHKSESRKLQSGDVSYEESSRMAASKSKLEMDGVKAEKAAATQEEARQLRAGDVTLREGSQKKGAAMKISGEGFSAHKAAMSENQQRQAITPAGTISQESSRKASKSGLTITAKGVCTKQSSEASSSENNISISGFENMDLNNTMVEFSASLSSFVDQLKGITPENDLDQPSLLNNISSMIRNAWSFPQYGHELGSSLCNVLRHNGGLDILLENCKSIDEDLKFSSAKVIEQCLTTENRGYVVEKDLKTVVEVACDCAKKSDSDQNRVGTGILEHLFKHNEGTCSNIIKMGGLEAVINKCKKDDKVTLQHCAGALANLSLYGGEENHRAMMKHKAQLWLFPLAFHEDANIKYYACLAIAALVANKEIEATLIKSGTLSLVEPFINQHIPEEFANYTDAHKHGQSKSWLQRLVPVLSSMREEARSLAAFHFCMEASIKKRQGNLEIFSDIGAIQPLKEVASSPNAIASKYAIQALRLMGEEVPHKLSQQVPLWSTEDVKEWVKQIGFEIYSSAFEHSKVDGDLLLRITDQNLKEDIGLTNGILRRRFERELKKLKQIADYSSCDESKVYEFLFQLGNEFTEYTYSLVQAGVTRDYLRCLKEEQLFDECNIFNSIHRQKIYTAIMTEEQSALAKDLDIFISYRRSNGSQLASLLKVHMTIRGFSAFIDVERLEAGKFDNNLLNSIQQAKTFLLVLTPNALDRCIGDDECKDWVHREIVAALRADCTIIPIIDNFTWPEPEKLPEDMRHICKFNGVRWIHDYQEACVDKVERFMRGEGIPRDALGRIAYGSTTYLGGIGTPGTPSSLPRAPPVYQRTASMESGKGSSCSDKDLSKD